MSEFGAAPATNSQPTTAREYGPAELSFLVPAVLHDPADATPDALAARPRELASSSLREVEPELVSFKALVRRVEIADGAPLYGTGLEACRIALERYPRGFAAAVDEAMNSDPKYSRRRLLCWLVKQNWHIEWERVAVAPGATLTEITNRCGCSHPECVDRPSCLRAAEGLA